MSRTPLVHVDERLRGAEVGDLVTLSRDERHHLDAVLRLRSGDPVEVADGRGGHATGELVPDGVRVTLAATSTPAPRPALRVVQALPKGRKLDEVVRLGVELGLDALVPVVARRSVRRPEGARADKAVARWTAVARSACEQSRRLHRPTIAPIAALADVDLSGRWLVAHPGTGPSLPEALAEVDAPLAEADVGIAVGPEGGWTDDEVEALLRAGARPVHLGPTVLRTEHAAAAALAVLGAWTGRWDRADPPTAAR